MLELRRFNTATKFIRGIPKCCSKLEVDAVVFLVAIDTLNSLAD